MFEFWKHPQKLSNVADSLKNKISTWKQEKKINFKQDFENFGVVVPSSTLQQHMHKYDFHEKVVWRDLFIFTLKNSLSDLHKWKFKCDKFLFFFVNISGVLMNLLWAYE